MRRRTVRADTLAAFRAAALAALIAACAAPAPRVNGGPAPLALGELSARDRAWVERTLASLSLREKVGQLIVPWVGGDYVALDSPEFDRLAQWVEGEGIGGVVMSMGLPHSYAAKLDALQRRARVPLLVSSDMENGPGMRMAGIYSFPHLLPQGGGTNFPPVMALGATGSDSLAYALGRVLAREARAVGVHVVFGPVLDVNSNPANPIINTRSFGEDPALVARLAAAYIRGAREGGVLVTGKHFPGHGDTDVDSHLDLPTIRGDRARLDSVELAPYRVLERELDGVMSAHIAVVGVEGANAPPATLSPYFLTTVLREELGFRGIIYTDAMDMGGIVRRYGETEPLLLALEAGADVLLMPPDVHAAIETVLGAVRAGRIAEVRIDASVRRVLEAKARVGLPSSRQVDLDAVDRIVGARAHTALAARIAERSITLARDDLSLVPLAASARRLLVVNYAAPTDPIAGRAFAAALSAAGRQVDVARVDDRTTEAELALLRVRADSADVVIAAAYVSPMEGSGTVSARGGFADFVQRLATEGKRVVGLSFGSPYLLARFPAVPAYVLAWGGADVSQLAAARALLGTSPIGGRLPVSIPPYLARGDGLQRGLGATVGGTPSR